MDKETYEKQKAFAGEKVPSMHRRMVGHDYQERQMYMITMVTEDRRPLLGRVVGKSEAHPDTPDAPRTEPTELGRRVELCWHEIALRYPQIDVLAFQLMPDHFHGILFVKERIEKPLGKVLLGFKQGSPLIYLQENGFTDLAKPDGKRMEACARGQLLILAPWEHHNEHTTISRNQCLSLNDMARSLCSVCCCTTAINQTTTNQTVANDEGV